MTVAQLKAILEDYDDNLEVQIAVQPSWPLVHALRGVVGAGDVAEDDFSDLEHDSDCSLSTIYSTGDCTCGALQDAKNSRMDITDRLILVAAEGHPYDHSPYGDKSWWDTCRT